LIPFVMTAQGAPVPSPELNLQPRLVL
jgi:hypothetical protein